jgi:hypothetical protein
LGTRGRRFAGAREAVTRRAVRENAPLPAKPRVLRSFENHTRLEAPIRALRELKARLRPTWCARSTALRGRGRRHFLSPQPPVRTQPTSIEGRVPGAPSAAPKRMPNMALCPAASRCHGISLAFSPAGQPMGKTPARRRCASAASRPRAVAPSTSATPSGCPGRAGGWPSVRCPARSVPRPRAARGGGSRARAHHDPSSATALHRATAQLPKPLGVELEQGAGILLR